MGLNWGGSQKDSAEEGIQDKEHGRSFLNPLETYLLM